MSLDVSRRRLTIHARMARFDLPPVESALVVGKRAPIGSRAMEKALLEMLPGAYKRIEVEHPMIEAIIVRTSHLHRVPEEVLVNFLIQHCEQLVDESEMLRVALDIEVALNAEVELP